MPVVPVLEAAMARASLDAEDGRFWEGLFRRGRPNCSAALELGRALYLQKPGAFAARFKRYARAWQ
jgi:hypothetical protein